MATLQHNITSITTIELLSKGDNVSNAKNITFSNVDASNDAFVDLFVYDCTNDKSYYILKDVLIPTGSTLVLNSGDNIGFDNSTNGFALRTQIDNGSTTAVPVDIIIKR